jgi:hypothetical protein
MEWSSLRLKILWYYWTKNKVPHHIHLTFEYYNFDLPKKTLPVNDPHGSPWKIYKDAPH